MRLRMARSSDAAAIRDLLEQRGDDVELARLVHFDPRRRYVLCATTLIDASERLVGVGAIELGPEEPSELLIDEQVEGVADEQVEGVADLLRDVLVSRAGSVPRARAA